MSSLIIPEFGRMNIYDDSNYKLLADDPTTDSIRQYSSAPYEARGYGSMPWGSVDIPEFSRAELKERIEEGHRKKLFPLYHFKQHKVPILDQKRTNYCWVFAVTGALMVSRVQHGFPNVTLSAASAGAPGKRYQNVGGWTGEAIGYISKFGLVPANLWPQDAINNSYFSGTREIAKQFNVGKWSEMRPRSIGQVIASLYFGYPVTVGLNWWRHAIYYLAPYWDGGVKILFANSWGLGWENEGCGVLDEGKATPDEVNCVISPKYDGEVYDVATAS